MFNSVCLALTLRIRPVNGDRPSITASGLLACWLCSMPPVQIVAPFPKGLVLLAMIRAINACGRVLREVVLLRELILGRYCSYNFPLPLIYPCLTMLYNGVIAPAGQPAGAMFDQISPLPRCSLPLAPWTFDQKEGIFMICLFCLQRIGKNKRERT